TGYFHGTTSYWSYQNDSQVANDSLSFRRSGSKREIYENGLTGLSESWTKDDPDSFSPAIKVAALVPISPSLRIGPKFQFSFSSFDSTNRHSNFRAYRESRNYRTWFTDSYDLHGITPPSAPYTGTFASNT